MDIYSQLNALNQEIGTTMFMILMAAYQVLLSRYTGQNDILVGTPIANRTRNETKGLVGFFLNTLVLRGDLSEEFLFSNSLPRCAIKRLLHTQIKIYLLNSWLMNSIQTGIRVITRFSRSCLSTRNPQWI